MQNSFFAHYWDSPDQSFQLCAFGPCLQSQSFCLLEVSFIPISSKSTSMKLTKNASVMGAQWCLGFALRAKWTKPQKLFVETIFLRFINVFIKSNFVSRQYLLKFLPSWEKTLRYFRFWSVGASALVTYGMFSSHNELPSCGFEGKNYYSRFNEPRVKMPQQLAANGETIISSIEMFFVC